MADIYIYIYIYIFYGYLRNIKNQFHASTHSRDIAGSSFCSTLGIRERILTCLFEVFKSI